MNRLRALRLLVLLPAAAAAQSVAPGDYVDVSVGPTGLPLTSTVSASAVGADGTIYVAGSFLNAGPTVYNRVAMRVGSSWLPMGSGIGGAVRAMVAADGSVYAGGTFTSAGGVPVSNVARWNGTAWEAMGAGVGFEVLCFTRGPDGSLYAGGFTPDGSAGGPRIARWDGTQWTTFATWPNGTIRGMAFGADGKLYLGGDFTSAGGVPMERVGRWSGTAWEPLGSGAVGNVRTLSATTDGTIYVGGELSAVGGVPVAGLARWTGTAWSDVGGGITGSVLVLAPAPDGRLLVAGGFSSAGGLPARNVAWWDGTSWTRPTAAVNSQVNTIAGAPDGSVVIGGPFTTLDGAATPYAARWTGSAWQALGSAFTGPVSAAVRTPDGSLYAAGDFTATGTLAASRIARWDGSTWSALGTGQFQNVTALTSTANGTLYAGGGSPGVNGVARWDPTVAQWLAVTGSVITGSTVLAVAARTSTGATTVYAGGDFFFFDGSNFLYSLAQTTGAGWSGLGSGVSGTVRALVVAPDGSLYVGGDFSTAGGAAASRIAHWDPSTSTWHALGSGVDGAARALVVAADGSLYVGGDFATAGGAAASRIAHWDPATSTWSALGSGVDASVHALAVAPDGLVYAGGDFSMAGGAAASRFARWDPATSSWGGPAAGPDATVRALAVDLDGDVMLGGAFYSAGSVTTPNVAFYDAPTTGAFGFEQPTATSVYRVGAPLKAIWTSPLPAPPTVVLSIRKGEGGWEPIYTGPNLARPDFGAARWLIPAGTPVGADYQFRIEDAADASASALSERFSIVDPASRFTVEAAPSAALGGAFHVTWVAPPVAAGGTVTLSLVPRGGGPAAATESTPNDGAHAFSVPTGVAPGKYLVVVTSDVPAGYAGESGPVRVDVAAVTAPGNGATATAGAPLTVDYEAPSWGGPVMVTIKLMQPGVAGSRRLARVAAQPASGSLAVTLPADVADGPYYVQFRLDSGSASYAASSGVFVVSGGTVPREATPATAHFAPAPGSATGAFATREAALTVHGLALPDGAEIGVFAPAGRLGTLTLVGAARVAGGRAELAVAGAVVVGALAEDGPAEATDYVLVADGAPLTLRLFDGVSERGLDAGAPLAFTEGAEWSLNAAAADPQDADVLSVAAWPNPTRGDATVRVAWPTSGPAEVAVFDALGRRVAVLASGDAEAGVHEMRWDARGVAPGVYVVRASSATTTAAVRVTVVR